MAELIIVTTSQKAYSMQNFSRVHLGVFDLHIGEVVDPRCLLGFFYLWVVPLATTEIVAPILMTNTSNGVVLCKDVPFGVSL